MRWSESVVVRRPVDQVRAAVADEHVVMQWSAWPQATGYSCAVDGDGTSTGSQIVFTDGRGRVRGRQCLVSVDPDRVAYRLDNVGPFGRPMTPTVVFRLEDLGDSTRVHLDFDATVPLPPGARQVAERVMGSRVRRLHQEDLQLLKRHVEDVAPAR